MRARRTQLRWGPIPRTSSYWANAVRPQWVSSMKRYHVHPTVRRLALRWLDSYMPGAPNGTCTADFAWRTILRADALFLEKINEHLPHADQ